MTKPLGVYHPKRVAAGCLIVLLSASWAWGQPNELTARLEKTRNATRAMMKGLNNRWFEYTLEYKAIVPRSRQEYTQTAFGIFSPRNDGRYVHLEYTRLTEGESDTVENQQHEVVQRNGAALCSKMSGGRTHAIEYAMSDYLEGIYGVMASQNYDVMRLFERSIATYVLDDFSVPTIDDQGRFRLELSPSMRRRTAEEKRIPEPQFRIFFDSTNDLPIASLATRADNEGNIGTREIRIAYAGANGRWFPARWLEETSKELSHIYRREFRIREVEPPAWHAEPLRMTITGKPHFIDPNSRKVVTPENLATAADLLSVVDPDEYKKLQDMRSATLRRIKENPPSAVDFSGPTPVVAPAAKSTPFPWLMWAIAVVLICGLAMVFLWFTAWRKLHVRSISNSGGDGRADVP